jgi:hypothetical protein
MNADELSDFPAPHEALSVGTDLGPLIAEGRILDSVATHDLHGTADEIASSLGVSTADLHVAIDELTRIAWVVVEQVSEHQLLVRLAEDARYSA